jgi:hypothetical protein
MVFAQAVAAWFERILSVGFSKNNLVQFYGESISRKI